MNLRLNCLFTLTKNIFASLVEFEYAVVFVIELKYTLVSENKFYNCIYVQNTMYLKIIIIYTVLIKCYINADCGCTTNRNNQNKECTKDAKSKTLHKYTEEANIVQVEDDLDPSEHFNLEDMVLISGSKFEMGTNKPVFPSDHEGPARNISMISFYLDKYEVSNEKFSKFISETGYKSEAEIFGDSFIFEMLVKDKDKEKYKDFRVVSAPWWIKMDKVDWKHPEGPGSTLYGKVVFFFFSYRVNIVNFSIL